MYARYFPMNKSQAQTKSTYTSSFQGIILLIAHMESPKNEAVLLPFMLTSFLELMDHGIMPWDDLQPPFIEKVRTDGVISVELDTIVCLCGFVRVCMYFHIPASKLLSCCADGVLHKCAGVTRHSHPLNGADHPGEYRPEQPEQVYSGGEANHHTSPSTAHLKQQGKFSTSFYSMTFLSVCASV